MFWRLVLSDRQQFSARPVANAAKRAAYNTKRNYWIHNWRTRDGPAVYFTSVTTASAAAGFLERFP